MPSKAPVRSGSPATAAPRRRTGRARPRAEMPPGTGRQDTRRPLRPQRARPGELAPDRAAFGRLCRAPGLRRRPRSTRLPAAAVRWPAEPAAQCRSLPCLRQRRGRAAAESTASALRSPLGSPGRENGLRLRQRGPLRQAFSAKRPGPPERCFGRSGCHPSLDRGLAARVPGVHASVRGQHGICQHDAGSMQFRRAHLTACSP